MTANADKDTTIAGTRLEAPSCTTSGCLSPCVSLSGVSATCIPYVSAQSQDFLRRRSAKQKEPSRGQSSDDSRAIAQAKSGVNHGLIWLKISYSPPFVCEAICPVADRSPSGAVRPSQADVGPRNGKRRCAQCLPHCSPGKRLLNDEQPPVAWYAL